MKKDVDQKINTEEFKKLFEEFGGRHKKISITLKTSDDFLMALGKLVRSFELITWNLQALIMEINRGHYDEILLSWMPFKGLVGALLSLCKQESFIPKKIKSLSTQLNNAEEIRNRLLHSMWIGGNKEGFISRYKKSKRVLKSETETYTIDDFRKINEWLEKLVTILEELVIKYRKRKKS